MNVAGCSCQSNPALARYRRLSGLGSPIVDGTDYSNHAAVASADGKWWGEDLFDDAGKVIKKGANAYIKAKLIGKQAPSAPIVQQPKRTPGFFETRNAAGRIVADPLKIGGVVAVAGIAVWLLVKSRRR